MADSNEKDRRVAALLAQAQVKLDPISETPSLDGQLLLMNVLGRPRAWLLAHPELELTDGQSAQFQAELDRYLEGEALPYVLGWWEFYGRQFHISPDVLIPRPETEHLVETALTSLAARQGARRIVEIGTGSGCVVVSLAAEFPERTFVASDISFPALLVAKKNSEYYGLREGINLIQSDLLHGLRGPFDLLLANLPYIASDQLASLQVARREPRAALDGGEGGLEPLARLVNDLPGRLKPGGELMFELDPGQMEEAEALLRSVIQVVHAERVRDLGGRERVLHCRIAE